MKDIQHAYTNCPHCGKTINLKFKMKISVTLHDVEKSEVNLP